MGGLIHILLVIALIVVLVRIIQGRRPLQAFPDSPRKAVQVGAFALHMFLQSSGCLLRQSSPCRGGRGCFQSGKLFLLYNFRRNFFREWLFRSAAPLATIPAAVTCRRPFFHFRLYRFPGSSALCAAVASRFRRTIRFVLFIQHGSRRLNRVTGVRRYRKRRKENYESDKN